MSSAAASPPGPTHFQNLLWAPKFITDPRVPIEVLTARHGRVWQTVMPDRRGLGPLVFLMGRDGNERILSPKYKDDFTWYEGYSFTLEPLFGRDILVLRDDEPGSGEEGEHRKRHRLLIPAFHPRLDDRYAEDMARILERRLGTLPTAEPIDLAWEIKRATFHIVAQLLFGAEAADLLRLTHLFEKVALGVFSVVHWNLPGMPFYRAKRASDELRRYVLSRIADFRRTGETPGTMLMQLLKAQEEQRAAPQVSGDEPLSDDTLVGELLAFLFVGYDTTASLLTSLFVALGENPTVYARLAEEARAAPDATQPGERGAAGLQRPYLDAVLLEAERLYPPLLFAMRGVRSDVEFAGFAIKRGSKVAYSPYYTGRQEDLYPDPLRFDPERFTDGKKPPPFGLVGFGGGHRLCTGKRFATIEMRLFVTVLLQRFDVEFLPGQSDAVYFNPTLQRKHGYKVRLRKRAA